MTIYRLVTEIEVAGMTHIEGESPVYVGDTAT